MKYRLIASALPLFWLVFFAFTLEEQGEERPGLALAALVLIAVPVAVIAFVAGYHEGNKTNER